VNGQTKDAKGFRGFSFRGLQAVEAKWNLVCICLNVRKRFRYGATAPSLAPGPSLTNKGIVWRIVNSSDFIGLPVARGGRSNVCDALIIPLLS